ncbi:ABC transporter permease [Terrihabitans soli]|uniref:ABC transporter permease n=1 Tax=Terrihabitans soli TaxID=708113 RepID=A0A6S6QN39_9HYPH|nr:DMT family transporter [Terrihabitans soli]BCJ90806.1 ABC transporter permease [Terrihabitans soli]
MNRMEWALLFFLSILWGGSFFFVGVAVKEIPPLTLVVLRVGLAALILLIIVRVMGLKLPRTREALQTFLVVGLIANAIPFCLLVWGQSHIASGLASILNATTPLATIAVAHVFTADEKMTGGRLAAVVLGIVGVAIMMGPDVLHDLGVNVLAQVACLGASLSYGFAAVFGRRFKRLGISPLVSATGQVSASSLMLLPVALLHDRPWSLPLPSAEAIASILALAAFSTALAYIVFYRLLETAGATRLTLVTFLIPVTAIFLGWAVLGEALHPRHFAGMALIGLGLLTIDGRLNGRRSTPPV